MSYFNYFRAHDQFMPRHFGFRGGGFLPPRGGVSITENVTIKNGPSGFWGFMTGLTQGLFGGGMGCGMGMGSVFGGMPMMGMGMGMPMMGMMGMSPYAYLNGATSQGSAQTQTGDTHLKNLTQAYSKSYEIVSHPDKKGIYQAFPKDGGKPIEGTYDELCDKLAKENEEPTVKTKKEPEKTEAQLKEEKAKEQGLELKDKDAGQDDKDTGSRVGGEDEGSRTRGSGTGVTEHGSGRHGVKVPEGWYRAPKGKDGQVMIANHSLRAGMSARQVTDIILNNKVNYLTAQDRNKLAAEVERYNPSIFKNGKVVDGADLSKLDIPSIDYIKNKYVNHDKMSTTSGTREARGTYRSSDGTSNTVGKTVTSTTGRYAKQINGKWHYFAQDGTELNETHVRKNDPDLWSKTH